MILFDRALAGVIRDALQPAAMSVKMTFRQGWSSPRVKNENISSKLRILATSRCMLKFMPSTDRHAFMAMAMAM